MGEICNSAYFKVIFTVSHVFRSHLWRFTFSWKITSLVEIVRLFSTKSRTALSQSFRHARLCLAEGPRPPRTVHASGVFLCFPVLPRCQRGGSTRYSVGFQGLRSRPRGPVPPARAQSVRPASSPLRARVDARAVSSRFLPSRCRFLLLQGPRRSDPHARVPARPPPRPRRLRLDFLFLL